MSHDPSRDAAARPARAHGDDVDDDVGADERDPSGVLARLLASFRGGEARPAAEALLGVASSRLAGKLGGAAHLAHLFANAAWAPLLGHRSARVAGLERIGGSARARIEVEAADVVDPAWRLTGLVREELAAL